MALKQYADRVLICDHGHQKIFHSPQKPTKFVFYLEQYLAIYKLAQTS